MAKERSHRLILVLQTNDPDTSHFDTGLIKTFVTLTNEYPTDNMLEVLKIRIKCYLIIQSGLLVVE